MEDRILHPGKLVAISSGEYSSYQVYSFFVVLKELNMPEVLASYVTTLSPDTLGQCWIKEEELINWLIAKGFLLEIDYTEWWIPDWQPISI